MTDTVRVSRDAVEEIADDLRAISLELTKKRATSPVSDDIFRKALALEAMLAASPQGEGSSAHPAPIKPSGDTGELRERVAATCRKLLCDEFGLHPDEAADLSAGVFADAILDLIQSERAGPRVSILDTIFHGNNASGLPIFGGHAGGITNITLHGWTCFGPDEDGQRALAGFQSERGK